MNRPATPTPTPLRLVGPTTEVVRSDLRNLHDELQSEVDRLMAEVSAQEAAGRRLEHNLLELSDRIHATGKRRTA